MLQCVVVTVVVAAAFLFIHRFVCYLLEVIVCESHKSCTPNLIRYITPARKDIVRILLAVNSVA